MLEILSPAQLAEWAEYFSLEPWLSHGPDGGYDLAEFRFGMLGRLIASIFGKPPPDFTFTTRPPPGPVDPHVGKSPKRDKLIAYLKKFLPPRDKPAASTPKGKL